MKKLIVLALIAFSSVSFASSVDQAVRAIEIQENAKCTYQPKFTVSKCLGIPKTCFYNVKFKCESNEGFFTLKVKVKEMYSFEGTGYVTKVRGTVIKR